MTAIANSTLARLRGLVDTLGNINAEISELERQAQAIKAELSASGLQSIEGDIFRAAIVISERNSLDTKLASQMLIAAGVEPPMKSTFVQSVRVSDRQG